MKEKDEESLFNVVHLPSEIEKSNFLGRFIYLLVCCHFADHLIPINSDDLFSLFN